MAWSEYQALRKLLAQSTTKQVVFLVSYGRKTQVAGVFDIKRRSCKTVIGYDDKVVDNKTSDGAPSLAGLRRHTLRNSRR